MRVPQKWQWFVEGRFGLFIHWGPYSVYGRGEQVLFRELLDQREYAARACAWRPRHFDARLWARVAREAGMRYAVLTTRHHDGFCLWDSEFTDYTSAAQAAGRDFVREFLEAFRDAGLRVGLYYSMCDWRIPAYWEGPQRDAEGFSRFRAYVHNQVKELLTRYGRIDVFWFDGAWPYSAEQWDSARLLRTMRELQPHLLINNRAACPSSRPGELGDFGTPEHSITPEPGWMWESCQVSVWRLWGYAVGERWRPADVLLDMLVEAASKGGNLLLNVGPDGEGRFPEPFVERARAIGQWLRVHGECIYGTEGGDVCEMVTRGYQTVRGNTLYLIIRFWDGRPTLRLAGLATPVRRAVLLTTGAELRVEQTQDVLLLHGLPREAPTELFPVIKLECAGRPAARPWAAERLWQGDPGRMSWWARARGSSVYADGAPRD